MPPKYRDILKRLRDEGWVIDRQRGSHVHLKHPEKPETVTVAGKPSDEPAEGTYRSILKQAGLKP